MHISETELSNEKSEDLSIVSLHRDILTDFINCQECLVSLRDPLQTLTAPRDSLEAH